MPNLYELMGEYDALQKLMDSEEVTKDQISDFLDRIDEVKGPLRTKVDNIARVLRNLSTTIEGIEKEEKRLKARRQARQNNIKQLREWMFMSMQILDVDKVTTDIFSVAIVDGPPKVVVLDKNKVPDEYTKVTVDVDKTKVKRAYNETGEVIDGCDIVREKQLRIR